VKPGGILFIHSYKRSKEHMAEWRYKYRPLTTRLPRSWIYAYVQSLGWLMHHLVAFLHALGRPAGRIAHRFVPFYRVTTTGATSAMGKREVIEFAKMITFDALTPKYDSPMATQRLRTILTEEGFDIEHLEDRYASPVYATARRRVA
jgi:hypothetical protein